MLAGTGEVRLHGIQPRRGPRVVWLHGFLEFWCSRKHEIPAPAGAGIWALVPTGAATSRRNLRRGESPVV
jgi:hypothetical protein